MRTWVPFADEDTTDEAVVDGFRLAREPLTSEWSLDELSGIADLESSSQNMTIAHVAVSHTKELS